MSKKVINKQHTVSYEQLEELLSVAASSIQKLKTAIEDNEHVTAASLNDLNNSVGSINAAVVGINARLDNQPAVYTKAEVDAMFAEMRAVIEENERITAAALNDLKS